MNYFESIFAMVICITMSAYFSATETAFSSLNKTRLKVLADNGNKRAVLALKLSGDYDRLISTILIGNNIVNIMIASIGTLLFVGIYGAANAFVLLKFSIKELLQQQLRMLRLRQPSGCCPYQ